MLATSFVGHRLPSRVEMPKRNIVWITVAAVIAALLWKVPQTLLRRDQMYEQFSPLLDVNVQVRKHYVEEVEDQVLLRGAIDGMLSRLDPYSEYYEAREYAQFQARTEGEFPGVGIEVTQSKGGAIEIVSPIEGSPAFMAGIRAGDLIIMVGQTKTADLSLNKAVELIKGKAGTSVSLTLRRPSTGETFERTIARQIIEVRTVRGWARSSDWVWDYLIDPEARIGYARISNFERHTERQLDEAIRELIGKHRMRALILDVRDNPGGLLDVVVRIADHFLPGGTIVSTKGRETPEQRYQATPNDKYPNIPIAILVNQGSASASEILSGCLRDHGRATVVGQRTFGKGCVQEIFPIENSNAMLKVTTAYYYLPKGDCIHGLGVQPNLVVELTEQERAAMLESQRAVYSTGNWHLSTRPQTTTTSPATRPATATAPATTTMPATTTAAAFDSLTTGSTPTSVPQDEPDRVAITIDRQLQAALQALRQQLTTRPSDN